MDANLFQQHPSSFNIERREPCIIAFDNLTPWSGKKPRFSCTLHAVVDLWYLWPKALFWEPCPLLHYRTKRRRSGAFLKLLFNSGWNGEISSFIQQNWVKIITKVTGVLTLFCMSSWAQSLCQELISKAMEWADRSAIPLKLIRQPKSRTPYIAMKEF